MKFIDDIRNLDRNNVGGWPKSIKWFFCMLLCGAIILGGYWFKVRHQQDDLATAERTEQTLRAEFSSKQAKVVNLVALKQQLKQMQDMLQQLLRQLPSKTEMPALLVDISQTALAAGLQVDLFQPGAESVKEFYAEKPISIRMAGTYHQFGTFISGVASLPRVVILTMHDVVLKPAGDKTGQLVMEGTVKTYRYLDDDETQGENSKQGGGK